MYKPLHKSYKGLFPFKVGTTSYIYPDNIIPNVRMLAPYLDEVELVIFESRKASNLPSEADIEQLVHIGNVESLGYNVHLPIDISLGRNDASIRDHGVAVASKVISLTRPLDPSTYTLHLSLDGCCGERQADVEQWKGQLRESLERILPTSVSAEKISVETLDYPFELVEEIVETLELSICLDIGHLILYGYSVADYILRYLSRTSIIHLHGLKNGQDHLSLAALSEQELGEILGLMKGFSGTVSIEVFSFHDLAESLGVLEKWRIQH
ncbi:MAG: sugar phosphate isomerase/epimerase [Deltaproteobacteria bacterium]|nr:sugar phosphate isomerase/epimerase [Deltaproteobacteria bacterium]